MRLIVFFDLPVVTKKDRKIYAQFRKFLIKDGYDMLQFSVYSRICNGDDGVYKHYTRLKENLPRKGSVRFFKRAKFSLPVQAFSVHRLSVCKPACAGAPNLNHNRKIGSKG